MRTQAIIAIALPLCALAQQPRVLHPSEITPWERYEYVRPMSTSIDPLTGRCACMACVLVRSTGEYVQVRMSCEACSGSSMGEVFSLDVVPSAPITLP